MLPHVHVASVQLPTFELLIALATGIAFEQVRHDLASTYTPRFFIPVLAAVVILLGALGAKLYYCVEVWDDFLRDPSAVLFDISGSGWYGGFILASVGVVALLRYSNMPVLKTLDRIIFAVPLAQAIGRLGCFLSGDGCYGKETSLPWGMSFPQGLVPTSTVVHPTPLYELIAYLFCFLLIWKLRRRNLPAGTLLGTYLATAGVSRFIVEYYRLNPVVALGLTLPQIVSLAGVVTGISILFARALSPRHQCHATPQTKEGLL
jgi:phosphatidylglycerol---prolipoprotein diacylglyceryl transferase